MKRRIVFEVALISCIALFISACAPKDIGEAKAKEIGLAYINQVFGANETEATVTKEQVECFLYQDGAIVSDGDASIATRRIYRVRVAKSESIARYEALVNGTTGTPYQARQNEMNIVLTDEQKEKANALYTEERSWGVKHTAVQEEMKDACVKWVKQNRKEDSPLLLSAETGEYSHTTITTTFADSFYVVMRNGVIYQIAMQWPSMQVLSIALVNEE